MTAVRAEELRPYHIVVSESLEHLVQESISGLPSREGVRIRSRRDLGVVESNPANQQGDTEEQSEVPDQDEQSETTSVQIEVQRTFVCSVPRNRFRNQDSVTRSTTEAHGGFNPRRLGELSIASS